MKKNIALIILFTLGMVYFIVAAYGSAAVQHNPASFMWNIALILVNFYGLVLNFKMLKSKIGPK